MADSNDRPMFRPLVVSVEGNLGRETEVRHSRTGNEYVAGSVAVSAHRTGSAAKPDWAPIWFEFIGIDASVVAMLTGQLKGRRVKLMGQARLENWVGRDGEQRQTWRLFVDKAALVADDRAQAADEAVAETAPEPPKRRRARKPRTAKPAEPVEVPPPPAEPPVELTEADIPF